jgi:hypothetical protein
MAVNKEKVNNLINRLSERDLELVTDLMERLAQQNYYREIPIDDEPTTQDDLEAIRAAHEALEKGKLIDLKDIEDELRS